VHARRLIEFQRGGLPPTQGELDAFARSYIAVALEDLTHYEHERAHEEGKEEHEYFGFSSLAPVALQRMVADCKSFQVKAEPIFEAVLQSGHETGEPEVVHSNPYDRAGSDFWLTRNGHGAGFKDGHWGDFGDQLSDLAHEFGQADLYVGDDGKVYQMGAEGDWQLKDFRAPGASPNSRGGAIQNVKVRDTKPAEPSAPVPYEDKDDGLPDPNDV
jgi:hypothetical protein